MGVVVENPEPGDRLVLFREPQMLFELRGIFRQIVRAQPGRTPPPTTPSAAYPTARRTATTGSPKSSHRYT